MQKTGFSNRRLGLYLAIGAGLVMSLGGATSASAQMRAQAVTHKMTAAMFEALNRKAKTRMPMRQQLSPEILAKLRDSGIGDKSGQAYSSGLYNGSGTNHKNSVFHYSDSLIYRYNTVRNPMRRTGHFLFTTASGGTFRCTASLISRSIIVTAGHCVHDGGSSGSYITSGAFYPARSGASDFPYGFAPATHFITTTGWATTGALDAGYDVGIVTLGKQNGTTKEIGAVVGWYGFCAQNCLQSNWYLTQLGYPGNYYGGQRMTMGQHLEVKSPSGGDYIYGSGMQGGSSGGPHIANLGYIDDSTANKGFATKRNIVFAVTSWGYSGSTFLDGIKIQGASSLSGPSNNNDFKTMYNTMCMHARSIHGNGSCWLFGTSS